MKAFKNAFLQFFAYDNIAQNTEYHKKTVRQRPDMSESDFFETLPPMEYYLMSAHFFMP